MVAALLQAVARNTASEVSYKTLAADISHVVPEINVETVSRYVGLLERLFVCERIPVWTGSLRSKARLRQAPKMMMADAALAAAVLRAAPGALLHDLETAGFLFETAVLHDLAVYAEALGGQLLHYRDSNGHEIDALIRLNDGRWGVIEIKLGGKAARAAAPKLARVVEQFAEKNPPSFLAVITGNGMTLPLENGVVTFPLRALAP